MTNAPPHRPGRIEIARNWLPRYTGMPLDQFGDYILLTNFQHYLHKFAEMFDCDVYGEAPIKHMFGKNQWIFEVRFTNLLILQIPNFLRCC